MTVLTISEEAANLLYAIFFIFGVAVSAHVLIDAIKWLLTRKKRRKYQITVHCDELTYSANDKEQSQ